MAESDRSHTLTFLYKVIDDNQATIRFLDTKAAFGIAVLGAMVGKLLDGEELAALAADGPLIHWCIVVLGLLITFAAFLGYKTIFPTVNPAQNVSFPDNLEPKFFISKFSRKSFWRLFSSRKNLAMLEMSHSDYCAAVRSATAEKIESIAAAEVLKLSFIRQLKMDRLSALAKVLVLAVFFFIFLTLAAPKSGSPGAPGSRVEYIYNLNPNRKECVYPPAAAPSPRNPSRKKPPKSPAKTTGK